MHIDSPLVNRIALVLAIIGLIWYFSLPDKLEPVYREPVEGCLLEVRQREAVGEDTPVLTLPEEAWYIVKYSQPRFEIVQGPTVLRSETLPTASLTEPFVFYEVESLYKCSDALSANLQKAMVEKFGEIVRLRKVRTLKK